jgi:hypothetical protein
MGFAILYYTKDVRTICFLSNFWEVNKRLVRKPFAIPKISTVLQEMEGFTFAAALDLNMGYYTIRLDPDASKIYTIIFPWKKYSYKQLPMGIAGSPRGSSTRVPAICFFSLAGPIFFKASPNQNKNRQTSNKERDDF